MIQTKCSLIGHISAEENLKGKLNNSVVNKYPELEDLTVIPSEEQQTFKSNKYGYNEVIVNAIETEELNIIPSVTEQTREGLFNKVTVAGDINLVPENIKEGTEIFGVKGISKTTSAKITDASYLFYADARLDYLNEILDLCENITKMYRMFATCKSLTTLSLSNLDTSNVTDMSYAFSYCNNLTDLTLSNFDTSKVTDMSGLLAGNIKLEKFNFNNFNTSKTTNMYYMFYNCINLTDLNLSSFDTSNLTNMERMFYNCNNLINLNLSNFNISKVTNASNMFYNCMKLTSLDLSSFGENKIKNISGMFGGCSNLKDLTLSNFDASNITGMSNLFYACSKLENFKGLNNLGKGYTQKTNNYSDYKLDLSSSMKLTHESLINIINNLYDLNLTYDVANGGTLYTQQLMIGKTNKAKLTADEIAIATNKGWTVS